MKHPQAVILAGLSLALVLATAVFVQSNSFRSADAAAGAVRCDDSSLYFPVDGMVGWRYADPASTDSDPSGNATIHTGVDIFATGGSGASVYAPGDGMVSRQNNGHSLNLILTGVTNVLTEEAAIELYVTHITPDLPVGTRFEAGDVIGTQEGDHIHFSVGAFMGFDDREFEQTQDPSPYFGAALSYSADDSERHEVTHWCQAGITTSSTPVPSTPAPTSTPSAATTEAAPAQPQEQEYFVQNGDTLGAIAEEFGVSVDAIAEASGLTDVDTLEVGQRLVIPGANGEIVPISGEQGAELSEAYVVQDGDTLSSIAAEFGVTVEAISSANGMTDVDFLSIGQELQIPSGASAGGSIVEAGPPGAPGGEYVVVDGDTLSSIAEAHGTDVETLQSLNGIDDPSFINVGDIVVLP